MTLTQTFSVLKSIIVVAITDQFVEVTPIKNEEIKIRKIDNQHNSWGADE